MRKLAQRTVTILSMEYFNWLQLFQFVYVLRYDIHLKYTLGLWIFKVYELLRVFLFKDFIRISIQLGPFIKKTIYFFYINCLWYTNCFFPESTLCSEAAQSLRSQIKIWFINHLFVNRQAVSHHLIPSQKVEGKFYFWAYGFGYSKSKIKEKENSIF